MPKKIEPWEFKNPLWTLFFLYFITNFLRPCRWEDLHFQIVRLLWSLLSHNWSANWTEANQEKHSSDHKQVARTGNWSGVRIKNTLHSTKWTLSTQLFRMIEWSAKNGWFWLNNETSALQFILIHFCKWKVKKLAHLLDDICMENEHHWERSFILWNDSFARLLNEVILNVPFRGKNYLNNIFINTMTKR